ncbi:hypothetical protein [Pedobacter sp. NJ-S-72]
MPIKKAFSVGFDFGKKGTKLAILKAEGRSGAGKDANPEEMQVVRNTILLEGSQNQKDTLIKGENLTELRIKKTANGYLQAFSFETYHDFISTRNAADWSIIGQNFGLSLDDNQVFGRLENNTYPIDNRWPQYNQGTKVRVSNYQKKWSNTYVNEPSLKDMLSKYLSLSNNRTRVLNTSLKMMMRMERIRGYR